MIYGYDAMVDTNFFVHIGAIYMSYRGMLCSNT